MRALIFLAVLLLLSACPQAENGTGTGGASAKAQQGKANSNGNAVTVWHEPTLAVPLAEVAAELKGQKLELNLVSVNRGELLAILGDGPPAGAPDIYIFAGQDILEALQAASAIETATARTFAGDLLAIVQMRGRGYKTPTLFDVYRLRFEGFGVMTDDTAVGFYSEQALITEGGRSRIEDKIIKFDSFEAVQAALEAEQVQMALATTSLVAQTPELEMLMALGEDLHEDIRYQAVAASGSSTREAVSEVLRLLAEDADIQAKLESYGLMGRAAAIEETK